MGKADRVLPGSRAVETLSAFSGIWIKVPNKRPQFISGATSEGFSRLSEFVILCLCELMELPLSKERGNGPTSMEFNCGFLNL